MLFRMVTSRWQKPRFSGLVCLSYVFDMLKKNELPKKYITERYITSNTEHSIFTINNDIFDHSIQINIKFTFLLYEYIIIYEHISYQVP